MKLMRCPCRLLVPKKSQRVAVDLIKRMSLYELNKPEEPSQEDCCQNGCNPCVFDIYKNQLKLWEQNRGYTSTERHDLLSQTRLKPFILKSITTLTANTNLYTFQAAIKDNKNTVGILPYKAGQYLALRLCNDTEKSSFVTRDYTIISNKNDQENCSFQVLIKLYDNSQTSEYIKKIHIGDITYWRGPYGDFVYEPNKFRNLLMICIGTGIAPMYPIINEILNNEDDETVIMLMFGCRRPSEIIFREQLSSMSNFWNFNYICYLSQGYSIKDKKYSETFVHGKISEEHIKSCFKFPVENLQVLVCGSKVFTDEVLNTLLTSGIPKTNVYIF
uniref:NADH-cytochrome b5 reductase n=1 Tax=Panstrongylus megistus TaxID=65343 RepID=A0A069DSX9_9HEMI